MNRDRPDERGEDGVEVPYGQINPETLRNMIEEFVTRDWSDFGDDRYTMEDKIAQVLRQLREGKVKIVFDLGTQTANLVTSRDRDLRSPT